MASSESKNPENPDSGRATCEEAAPHRRGCAGIDELLEAAEAGESDEGLYTILVFVASSPNL